jgi:hypothetical protein
MVVDESAPYWGIPVQGAGLRKDSGFLTELSVEK